MAETIETLTFDFGLVGGPHLDPEKQLRDSLRLQIATARGSKRR